MPKHVPVPQGGRRIEPTESDIKKIQEWAGKGNSGKSIAAALGIGNTLFQDWRKRHPAVQAAFEAGMAVQEQKLYNALFRQAMKGNVVAAIYLTKARFGWREGDAGDSGGRANVIINLPGARKPEEIIIEQQHERLDNR